MCQSKWSPHSRLAGLVGGQVIACSKTVLAWSDLTFPPPKTLVFPYRKLFFNFSIPFLFFHTCITPLAQVGVWRHLNFFPGYGGAFRQKLYCNVMCVVGLLVFFSKMYGSVWLWILCLILGFYLVAVMKITVMSVDVRVISWNVRGLNSKFKRALVLKYLKASHPHIMILQETHMLVSKILAMKTSLDAQSHTCHILFIC